MAKFVEIDIKQPEDEIKNVDHNFYSKLKPTLFMLRFLGGPTGLWRVYSKRSDVMTIITQLMAFLMLLVLNVGTVFSCYMVIRSVGKQDYKHQSITFVFFALFLNVTGVFGLDVLWYRRQVLRDLLNLIDFEPKIGEQMDKTQKRWERSKSRKKTIKLMFFMLFFSVTWGWTVNSWTGPISIVFGKVYDSILCFIIGIDILLFALIITFYITFSWIFRIKVENMIKHLKKDLIPEARNGQNPDSKSPKMIEIWFKSLMIQMKKFDQIFKQFAGFVSIVMIWSVLAYTGYLAKRIIGGSWQFEMIDFVLAISRMCFQLSIIFYSLSCLSAVEHSLKRLIKLLYQLSLSMKFNSNSNDKQSKRLGQNYKLLAETIDKSELSFTIFGLIHINRSLITRTMGLLGTFTLLIYELSGDRNEGKTSVSGNHTVLPLNISNQTTLSEF